MSKKTKSGSNTRNTRQQNRSVSVRQNLPSQQPQTRDNEAQSLIGPTGIIGPQGTEGTVGFEPADSIALSPTNTLINQETAYESFIRTALENIRIHSDSSGPIRVNDINSADVSDSDISSNYWSINTQRALDDAYSILPYTTTVSTDSINEFLNNSVNYTPPFRYGRDTEENENLSENEVKMFNEGSTSLIIKNRSVIFKNFIRSVKFQNIDFFKGNTPSIESRAECKKRAKYWGSKLFDPVTIYMHKLLFVASKGDLDKGEPKWIDINEQVNIVPIGLDIWGTYGGALQAQSDKQIEWEKTLLIFVPDKKLLSKIKDFSIDVCFTNAGSIKIINNQCTTTEKQSRKIQL